MKTKILKELQEATSYRSGQDLCDQLGVSRTAIWKHIKALKEEGYVIDSVSNKGYRLLSSPDVLSKEALVSHLHSRWLGKNLKVYDTIDSTNLEIRRLAEVGEVHGTLAIAEEQTMGKGRRGRHWEAPKGTGIWMSFLLRPEIALEHSSMITLVTALAVAKGIQEVTGIKSNIKWPNDIILHGKKVCGILTELSAQMDELNYLVVGIGINVNTQAFVEDIKDVATSIFMETGKKTMRAKLVAEIVSQFETYYDLFLEHENLQDLMEEYNSLLVHKNQEIQVVRGEKKQMVLSRGINAYGELLVEDSFGKKSTLISGEVSVRGILNYI